MFHEGTFAQIISPGNLFLAWQNYRQGKRSKADVQKFEHNVEDNVFVLADDLLTGAYRPGGYSQFIITDPKRRQISKASIRDRLLHQAIYQILYPAFDKIFIFDSYSCRNNKGTHKAFARLVAFTRQVREGSGGQCWALKMDIKKFFDSVDHEVLAGLLEKRIADPKLLNVIYDIIGSFEHSPGKGMPLGNLTSQLFANIYLDPLDKFVKHHLKAKYYLRYADDFMVLSPDPHELLGYLVEINRFLKTRLKLNLHPDKVILRKLSQGIDFVGYVAFPHHQLARHKTVKRIIKKASQASKDQLEKALPSYLGYLKHASSYTIQQQLTD